MMTLKDLIKAFENAAPFALQESYDNSGIQYGDPLKTLTAALLCLDITEEVVMEAIEKRCDVIISHHPMIFKGLKSITGSHYTEKALILAIRNDIALVSVHTNLDSVARGVNGILAERIGIIDPEILDPQSGLLKKLVTFCPIEHAERVRNAIFAAGAGQIGEYDCCSFNLEGTGSFRGSDKTNPYVGDKGTVHFEKEVRIETILPGYLQNMVIDAMIKAHPYEEVAYDLYPLDNTFNKAGIGMIGYLEDPQTETDFLEKLKTTLGTGFLRHSEPTGKMIHKVAVCGGSGAFLKDKAIRAGADAFVTADLKYHDFFDARQKLLLIDAGHYETEQFTVEILHDIISKNFTNFALLKSEQEFNPVRYF